MKNVIQLMIKQSKDCIQFVINIRTQCQSGFICYLFCVRLL